MPFNYKYELDSNLSIEVSKAEFRQYLKIWIWPIFMTKTKFRQEGHASRILPCLRFTDFGSSYTWAIGMEQYKNVQIVNAYLNKNAA